MLGLMNGAEPKADEKATLVLHQAEVSGRSVRPGSTIDDLCFQFNPKEYTVQAQAQWRNRNQKTGIRPPQYQGVQPSTLKLDIQLDQRLIDLGKTQGAKSVEDQAKLLLSCVKPTDTSSGDPYPPVLKFLWGSGREFIAVAKSVSAKFTMFDPDGTPVRAKVTLQLSVFDGAWPNQNPTSGTPKIDRLHQVQMGENLPLIAHREYGDPTLWRAIAMANDLVDPTKVVPGSTLLLPPAGDAVRLVGDRA